MPVVSVGIADGEALAQLAGHADVKVYDREESRVDASAVTIWLLGVGALCIGSWRAAGRERGHARWALRGRALGDYVDEDADIVAQDISSKQAAALVCVAAAVLVALFYLISSAPWAVVYTAIVIFSLGGAVALRQLIVAPLMVPLLPRRLSEAVLLRCDDCDITPLGVLSSAVSIGVCATWAVCRHSAWAWVLQDVLALCLVTLFLLTARLPNARVGVVLLTLFFAYDIFMVFISPWIFGESVMVEVATAGAAGHDKEEPVLQRCVRTQGERMPMLFLVPHGEWPGGYSMLGLGDVVLPGLLVTYALRCDYTAGRGLGAAPARIALRGFYPTLIVCYAAGLFLAYLANTLGWTINGVRGQPALLYLVPLTLGPLLLMAWRRGELPTVWGSSWTGAGDDGRAGAVASPHRAQEPAQEGLLSGARDAREDGVLGSPRSSSTSISGGSSSIPDGTQQQGRQLQRRGHASPAAPAVDHDTC